MVVVSEELKQPKASILMSVYNGESYLKESIDSVLSQKFDDFEFIIVDDCSTDETPEILALYAEKDSRIILLKNDKNLGLTKSLNKGLYLAKGKYIARQDADDISFPTRLEKQVSYLDEHEDVGLVSSNIELINSEGEAQDAWLLACEPILIKWHLLFYNYISGHSQVAFRRELVLDLGGYNEDYVCAQDFELWSRVIQHSGVWIIPEVLLKYRTHEDNVSSKKRSQQQDLVITQVQRNIGAIADINITFEQARNLWLFWKGDPKKNLSVSDIIEIHPLIRKIYSGFIAAQNTNKFKSELLIRKAVALRFLAWFKFWSKSFIPSYGILKVLFHAYSWQPSIRGKLSALAKILILMPKVTLRVFLNLSPQRQEDPNLI